MKITPSATNAAPGGQQAPPSAAQVARDRAIAAFTQSPVLDQNKIAPEEMGAIMKPSGQIHSSEPQEDVKITTAEAAAPEETKASEEKPVSEQHLALIRREKALRAQALKQEQTYKAREQALTQRESEFQAKSQQTSAPDYSNYVPKDQIKQNALQVLSEAGVSYEDLTQQILNQGSTDPRAEARAAALEAKIAKLEAQMEEGTKAQATAQEEQYKAAVKQIATDVKRMVFTDDTFEMIKVTNSVNDVVELIEATWKEKGELLSNEEAAQMVEDYLIDEAEKLARTSKMKKRLTPAASVQVETSQVKTPVEQSKQATGMKTLTNTNSVSRQLTAKERAVLAFKGELK